ncbi:MAG: ABC transporter permease/substrate-binding protein [Pyrinomonadaceae bacterium]|nr:ABC transporter permease/substrate-binding protein [Blastocatellia bacterium]MCW5956679.1 ABC transporter permease/substrate-binding protein [Pyrinomonadaceae bacterium]
MQEFFKFLAGNWPELLVLTREHIFIVLLSTGLAVLIGLPLGILLTRIKSLQTPVLGFANIIQTVPSLALFGLLIPIPFIGGIGARTAVIALALYALLPVIRNTVTGILGIDPKIREAAVALGMTPGQILRLVELPLAAPVILTGIRVAVVISVGVATVAAAVGAGGLGTYIFRGLRQNDNNLLLAGAIASALLALLCDFVLGQVERSFKIGERSKGRRLFAVLGAAAVFVAIIAASYLPARTNDARISVDASAKHIVVGSKDFTESVILAEILSQMLEKQGVQVERRFELGGNLAHDGLLSGEIDVYPEYTGTAYTAILKHPPITDPQAVYEKTKAEYADKFNLELSPPLGFANDFAILVRGDVARKNNLKTISDAVAISRDWQAGFGQDFMSRADGYPGFSKAYGFNFARQPREMDLSLTYRALQSRELDLIAGNSTDGLISALDLFQLEDDRHYFPPYQAVFVARSEKADALINAFNALKNAVSTEDMRKMNYEVDGKKRAPREVALYWVSHK